jgi:peptidyl-prolyl cis-trans isomerase SurA
MKKIFACAAAVLAGVLAGPVGAEVLNRIVATVDGEPITAHELDQYIKRLRADLNAPIAPPPKDALQALITEKLVEKEIVARKVSVGDEDIELYIQRILEQNKLNKDQLAEALKQQGLSMEAYRKQVKGEIEKIQLLNREIRGKVNVTPQDVERYYEAHKKDYEIPAQVQLRHIVLRLDPNAPDAIVEAANERLLGIRKRIVDDGEDFAKVAKEVSEDPAGQQGGDLGEVEPSKVLEQFATALEKMDEGEVSEPIRTSSGLHILKLEKRIVAGYRPIADVSAAIKDKLYAEALDQRYRRWLEEDLQKRHFVEVKL